MGYVTHGIVVGADKVLAVILDGWGRLYELGAKANDVWHYMYLDPMGFWYRHVV
jgi:hypothetical protein